MQPGLQQTWADYRVLEDSSESGLADKVRTLMKQGWVPLGGVAVTHEGGSYSGKYVQAMGKPLCLPFK